MLSAMIERETADTFDLDNGVTIEVSTASFRTVRGYTVVAALCDEIAFWPTDDASEPDYEVLNALRPASATIPGSMLLCASSPYAKRGALWDAHRRHFGKDGDPILVLAERHPHDEPVCAAVADRRCDGSRSGLCCSRVRRTVQERHRELRRA